ncbi:MAG: serine/threonine protein phosphatase [Proteobacteria bacterium]|nr:serine/threonine protein phosphatase [Pseudomonadota bacterium]
MLIIAFGDIHMEPKRALNIPDIKEADCVVITGDLTVYGGRAEALQVLEPITSLNSRIYAQIGNMDKKDVDLLLTETGINLDGKGVMIGDIGLFGLGGSNPTPFNTPSEFSEAELEARLHKAYEEVSKAKTKILFSHTPPLDTDLDRVGNGDHVGSISVRNFLEQHSECQVCVCGHIHEAIGTDRVGSSVVLNPGMLSKGGYARIECNDHEVKATVEMLKTS